MADPISLPVSQFTQNLSRICNLLRMNFVCETIEVSCGESVCLKRDCDRSTHECSTNDCSLFCLLVLVRLLQRTEQCVCAWMRSMRNPSAAETETETVRRRRRRNAFNGTDNTSPTERVSYAVRVHKCWCTCASMLMCAIVFTHRSQSVLAAQCSA